MPLIRNLRLGHATNSSSSHSIVLMRTGQKAPRTNWEVLEDPDVIAPGLRPGREWGNESAYFGYSNFILADARSKLMYLAVENRSGYKSWEQMRSDFQPWLSDDDLQAVWNGGIDNRSGMSPSEIPRELLLENDVVILGGGDDKPFTLHNATKLPDLKDVRRKQDGTATIWYSPSSGFKARFSPEPYLKASSPELVDVKITDYCPYGCSFCYQGSTREGAHAPLELILRTADRLAEIGVFEVALGGGEPMMHPDFAAVIRGFRDRGITPNVTSFGVEWLKRKDVMDVIGLIGGLGVSVQDADAVHKVVQIQSALARVPGGQDVQVLAQHAVGTGDLGDLVVELCNEMYDPALLLLGYKNVGRGVEGQSHPQSDGDLISAVEYLRDYSGGSEQLSVDTAFLDHYPNVIDHLDVPDHMTSSPEGMFSMYIDLVAGKMGPSSYCSEEAYVPLDLDGILDVFALWQPLAANATPEEAPVSYVPS